jgi:hypothetical protein
MTFTQAFAPALNKEGFVRLEFMGHEIKSGIKEETDKDTGEIVKRDWSFLNLIFEAKGLQRGSTQKVTITSGFNYAPDNLLGITLSHLGYEAPKVELVEDSEGFLELATDEDEDGFGQIEAVDLGIEEFLDSIKNYIFAAKIFKASEGKRKGFWQINAESISLLKKPV